MKIIKNIISKSIKVKQELLADKNKLKISCFNYRKSIYKWQ